MCEIVCDLFMTILETAHFLSAIPLVLPHVFHYDRIATQLRRNCDRTVTRNCEKLRRSYA